MRILRATRGVGRKIFHREIFCPSLKRIPYQETKSYVKLVMTTFITKDGTGEEEEKMTMFDELLPPKKDIAGFEADLDTKKRSL